MKLFAEHGFRATTVGEIEAAAGLQPRRGALYKHFDSKEALLRAAAGRYAADAAVGASQIGQLPTVDGPLDLDLLRPLVRALGRWFLETLDEQHAFVALLEHEGPRLADLAATLRRDIIDVGNGAAAQLLEIGAPAIEDPEATAVLLLSSLVGLRRTAWTFGAPALEIDDERAIECWTDLVLATASSERQPPRS